MAGSDVHQMKIVYCDGSVIVCLKNHILHIES